jgi:prolyl-tRNA synthetase
MKDLNTDKKITPRAEDFSAWYQDVIDVANLAEHGPVKGTMVIKPYGYSIWENIMAVLDKKFKELGVQNAYFPMFIPESFLKKEESHVEGFSPEVAVVTYAGGKKLQEALIVRPTSETIIYDAFSRWINSYRDLPIVINQWANVVRWELRPRLFLRTTEFLWQEGHTAHTTYKEADDLARTMLNVYKQFAEDYLAIPVIIGIKSDSEKFAGAVQTYTVEAMMQDGKALQFATSHNLGQNFSKVFNVSFNKEDCTSDFVWQTSWGLSTRTIGALIMVHSDDLGLVLPPKIAPIHVVIVPVWNKETDKEAVTNKALGIKNALVTETGLIVNLDTRDLHPGEKYYYWEKRGVPIRIEIGPRDLKNEAAVIVRRDTGVKDSVKFTLINERVTSLLKDIQSNLFSKALKFRDSKIKEVSTWEDFVKEIENGNFVLAYWSGEKSTEEEIKEKTKATIRCIPLSEKGSEGKCVLSGKPSHQRVIFARAY